eukprot:1138382-Pelagomonas_calceolata.AAC.2
MQQGTQVAPAPACRGSAAEEGCVAAGAAVTAAGWAPPSTTRHCSQWLVGGAVGAGRGREKGAVVLRQRSAQEQRRGEASALLGS